MRKKISPGLIATNGDGQPTVPPKVPANWSGQSSALAAGDKDGLKPSFTNSAQASMSASSGEAASEPPAHSSSPLPSTAAPAVSDSGGAITSESQPSSTNTSHAPSPTERDNPSASTSASSFETQNEKNSLPVVPTTSNTITPSSSDPMPHTKLPEPCITQENRLEESEAGNDGTRPSSATSASLPHVSVNPYHSSGAESIPSNTDEYIENKVVESFLEGSGSEMVKEMSQQKAGVLSDKNTLPGKGVDGSRNEHSFVSTPGGSGMVSEAQTAQPHTTKPQEMDAVSMTIASVAAGEGEPSQFLRNLAAEEAARARGDHLSHQHHHTPKHKKTKHDKMSASARLPVISSLLAPTGAIQPLNSLPGIQHIAPSSSSTSRGASNSPNTVLPSVAHFLGPAKSPPNPYTTPTATDVPYNTEVGEPNEPSPLNVPYQNQKANKASRKPVTPAGLRLSMAASEELPDPLPLPQYSEKVLRAKQLGTVAFDRPTVLRETVQFFLQFKHYWSSHDYDRISNLVVELFPEFKDTSDTPGVQANKRIRTDLSMYARNFRRREVSQRKKEGSGSTPPGDRGDHKHESPGGSTTPSSNPKNFLQVQSPATTAANAQVNNAIAGNNNAADFCNELLTAASIIESQNSNPRTGESMSHGNSAVHKQETVDVENVRPPSNSGENHLGGSSQLGLAEGDPHTPIHFVYDKEHMSNQGREANTAWQLYSDQVAQMASGSGLEYGVSEQAIKKDLGTCARNMRRRLPQAKFKPTSGSAGQKTSWSNSQTSQHPNQADATATNQAIAAAAMVPGTTADYMKAFMAAQNLNLSELGMTQRNLGELAVLAGIKQRMEQHPSSSSSSSQEVSDLERQYLAQCSTEEQRQALLASGAFGSDSAAMAALTAFYGQLGVDITGGTNTSTKRGISALESSLQGQEAMVGSNVGSVTSLPNTKRQRRISQAEVEKRLREAELSGHHGNHHHHHGADQSSLTGAAAGGKGMGGVTMTVSEKASVKREPLSPGGSGSRSSTSSQKQSHTHQQVVVPSSSQVPTLGIPVFNPHDQQNSAYWEMQAAANMALVGAAHTTPHSQSHQQHMTGQDLSGSDMNTGTSTDTPMNLVYHESVKQPSGLSNSSPAPPDSLPDTAGLAAQVEVTTSNSQPTKSPRRRTSSSPRGGHAQQQGGDSSRDQQVWFPHGSGFKKENQEIVCLPEPLPIPDYSQKILAARSEGASVRHRSEIIRETARFFLGLKYWWSSADYTRISELVVQQFPDLKDENSTDGLTNYRRIQRDLSMCARNLRRSKKPRKIRELSGDPSNTLPDYSDLPPPPKKPSKSKSEKKKRMGPNILRTKKVKNSENTSSPAVVTEPAVGMNEDMTAAAALLQQQFMQQTGGSNTNFQHPSAHLLPSSHLLPPLQTHPALHDQQIQQAQLSSALLQQEGGHSVAVEDPESNKRLVKEEPTANVSASDNSQYHSGVKSNGMPSGMKSSTPSLDVGQQGELSAEANKQAGRGNHGREMEGAQKQDTDKTAMYQVAAPNSRKTYMDPDHGSDLQEKFANLWKKGKFFDASLGVANKKLHVHKLILLAMSPYLQETFKNADPRSQLEVNLPSDTSYETAKAFLTYIYEGVLEVDTASVRSLYKIASMLQMTKLAQYCQNFAHALQEEAEGGGGEGEQQDVPKISVNLGEWADIQAQRQRILEAQSLGRIGETHTISSSELQRRNYHHAGGTTLGVSDEHGGTGQLTSSDLTGDPNAAHFLHPPDYRTLVGVSSTSTPTSTLLLSSSHDSATQQLLQAALARNQAASSSASSPTANSSLYHHQHHHNQQQQQHQQQQQQVVSQTEAALLQRLASSESSTALVAPSSSSLEHQQRLALAYWQAQTFGEMISRNPGLTSEPNTFTSASEAVIAAAAASTEDGRHLLSSLGHSGGHDPKVKVPNLGRGGQDSDGSGHQGSSATMLPETCLPVDMASRSQVNHTSDGAS